MARILDTNLANRVDNRLGTKPLLVVDCYWTAVNLKSYADKDYDFDPTGMPRIKGQLLQVSGLENIVRIAGGTSFSINVKLSDIDGSIKNLMRANDIHKRPVTIRHAYTDLSPNAIDTIVLAYGFIYTPIVYNPVERTISFTVSSKLEDREVGFSPEQGQFNFIADEAVGVAWPLCFGLCKHVPAVKINVRRLGTNLTKYSLITTKEIEEFKERAREYAQLQIKKDTSDYHKRGLPNPPNENIVQEELVLSDEEYVELTRELMTKQTEVNEIYDELVLYKPDSADDLQTLLDKTIEGYELIYRLDKVTQAKIKMEDDLEQIKRRIKTLPEDTGLNIHGNDQHIFNEQQTLEDVFIPVAQDEIDDLTAQVEACQTIIDAKTISCQEFSLTTLKIDKGRTFPQSTSIVILIKGKAFEGTFSGDVFTITDAAVSSNDSFQLAEREDDRPNHFWVDDAAIKLKGKVCFLSKLDEPNRLIYVTDQVGKKCIFTPTLFVESTEGEQTIYEPLLLDETYTIEKTSPFLTSEWLSEEDNADTINTTLPEPVTGYSKLLKDNDWTIDVGDDVTLRDDYFDTYIANCVPLDYTPATDVYSVMAYRSIKGVKKLVPIPQSYYNVRINEVLDQLRVTAVELPIPLVDYDEGWDGDTVYVTLKSNLPTNPANVISFLITKYSNLTYDFATFSAAATYTQYFKCNFALLNRGNVLRIIDEIAWQAKSVVYVKNNTYYIKFLAAQLSDAFSYTEDDLLDIEIAHTSTEEIVTVFEAKYRTDYLKDQKSDKKLVLRNNIFKYGQHKESFDFYIYTDRTLVEHIATFWLIRYSNTWKRIKFKTPIHTLRTEPYDSIGITLASDIVSDAEFQVIIESVVYDTNALTLEYEGWIPIRSGESSQYLFAFTYDVSELIPFPYITGDPYVGGNTNGYNITSGGGYDYVARALDWGKQFPSDLSITILPLDPEVSSESDYLVREKRKPKTVPSSKLKLSIHDTFLRDDITGTEAPLSQVFAVLRSNKDRFAFESRAEEFDGMRGYLALNGGIRVAQYVPAPPRTLEPSENDPVWPIPGAGVPTNPMHEGDYRFTSDRANLGATPERVLETPYVISGQFKLRYDYITREFKSAQIVETFMAIITGAVQLLGFPNRWLYQWNEVTLLRQSDYYVLPGVGDLDITPKRSGIQTVADSLAINLLEMNNESDAAGPKTQGNGIVTGLLSNGNRVTLLPVGGVTAGSPLIFANKPCVIMHKMRRIEDGKVIFVFQYENSVDCIPAP